MHVAMEDQDGERAECVRLLLDAGALSSDVDDEGKTALWLAIDLGQASTVEALLQAAPDLETRDEEGHTLLMYVSQYGSDTKKVEALLAGGASMNTQHSETGFNALACALARMNCEGAVALMEAGSSLTDVVEVADSNGLLKIKKGLDDLLKSYYSIGSRSLVRLRLREVVLKLHELKRAGDPAAVLRPWQKQKLTDLAQKARANLKLKAKEKRLGYRSKKVSFAPVRTLAIGAEVVSSSRSEDTSDSEGSSISKTRSESKGSATEASDSAVDQKPDPSIALA
jgi:hypothetical protein